MPGPSPLCSAVKNEMKRSDIKRFRDIPNVGAAIEKDFFALGIGKPIELMGKDPYQMYSDLCRITRKRHDPCVIDVFISAVSYMEGGPSKKWWEFTEERKKQLSIYHEA
jgi:hypothetical protein